MATAVVCDDDRTVRAAVSAVCVDAGLEVVAETDSGADAAEMVRRFDVDVLILDLSLADGSGDRVLADLHAGGSSTTVVVFTAFGDDPAKLLRLGAREVVEKPDFELLGAALADVGPLLVADCRLAVAAVLRDELRVQDLLHEAPEVDGFVALLRGGDARAAGAVWSRVTAAVRRDGLPGELKGTAARVDSIGAKDAMALAVGALHTASVGSPPFVSV